MADYEIYLYTPQGVLTDQIARFSRLDCVLVVNEIGSLTIELPGQYSGTLDEDYRIEVWRDGYALGETQFFVTGIETSLTQAGRFRTRITAESALKIADWAVVDYATGLPESHHNDYAGNIIKQVARQNIGTLADDTSRDMSSYMTVQADANDGAVVELDIGWRNLLDAFNEIAGASTEAGTPIWFDVVRNAGQLQLQTFTGQRGTDRSTSIVLSPERGTLADARLMKDYSVGANRIIVGGAGQEIWRNTATVTNNAQINNSPFGYIKEHFLDANGAATTADATAAGNAYMRQNQNKVTLTGRPVPSPGSQFGADYFWGDKITIEFLGYVAVVYLDRVQVTVSDNNEQIQITARGNVV